MDAAPAGPTPTESTAGPRRGLRIGLGTMLCLVAMAAPVAALAARVEDPGAAVPLVLVLILCGMAVGAARRCRAREVAAQIGLTAAAGLLWIGLGERIEDQEVATLYFLLGLFAVTTVAPLIVRNALEGARDGWRGTAAGAGRIAWNVGLTTWAVFAFVLMAELVPSMATSNNIQRAGSTTTVRTPEERIAGPFEDEDNMRGDGTPRRGCEVSAVITEGDGDPALSPGVR